MFTINLDQYRLVDLSPVIEPPGTDDRPLEVRVGRLADNAYKMDITRLHTHVGTHVEAPAHFYEDGKLITEYRPPNFFGPAVLLSIDDPADRLVTGEILEREVGDIVQPGHILLCRNGMEQTRSDEESFPTLTPDAARWMLDRQIKLMGIDCWFGLGPDVPATRELHDILMSQDICLVEGIVLDDLQQQEFFFMALPVAFALDSGFARAIALEER